MSRLVMRTKSPSKRDALTVDASVSHLLLMLMKLLCEIIKMLQMLMKNLGIGDRCAVIRVDVDDMRNM